MEFDKNILGIQSKFYYMIVCLTWILYIIIAFGISINAPEYLDTLQYYVKIYISLFLIIRFNPFTKVKFTELDTNIAFSAGIFLLGTTAINNILHIYLSNIKQNFISFLSLLKIN
jgi:hypothetical protein